MPSPQKIGVLTFHRCINYGSYWQARHLVEGLRQRGKDAVLLDHHSTRVNRAEWKCALSPLLPARTPRSDHRLYARKTRKFIQAFGELPRSRPFALENPAEMESYDLVVVGSDEVWNLRHPWYGGAPLFFGEGLKAQRVAAYAASFGNQNASEGLDPSWAGKLQNFARLSVRDENSRRLVRNAMGHEPSIVLDPCLQFGSLTAPENAVREDGRVLVYGHSFPGWYQQTVRQHAKARGLRLVSIGYRNDWADEQVLTAGPEEFAQAMAEASVVATNFFHGCVFAILNGKPFLCAGSEYRFNKISDLLAMLGAGERLATEDTPEHECARLLDEPLSTAATRSINELREVSSAYIDDVLH